ncbi:hypothetical protein E6R18_25060 [Streptomyces sp. A1277]|uniref:hypothetical protein n=1 Tax=Streptomyces sp. A1277 TaxID=2563103 RepID=UPI0010A25863|nr:hypothetical protein [Streptomyces sp. A1277]THA29184.1 hypothetical protein E6R18_25060 [Streptomyces sp. A1277]
MTEPAEPSAYGVSIDAQPGQAAIRLNGELIPSGQVTGYVLEHDVAAALPTLILHTRQPDHVQWQGLARVAVADPGQDAGQAVAAFLQGIDPGALERVALERDDLDGSSHELTVAMLRQLADWALGRN